MIYIHVVAGSFGIFFGFLAMLLAKGTHRHKLAGNGYVLAMFTMTGSALIVALMRSQFINMIAALLTFYLVATAWMTMHRRPEDPQRPEVFGAVLALLVGLAAIAGGVYAANSPGGMASGFEGIPAPIYFMFGAVALLSAWGDYRLIRRRSITRTQKLVRHLWRMGYSLWVATSSFFLGQARHLPDWFKDPGLHFIPVLLALVLLVFWAIRVRFPPWTRKSRPIASAPAPAKP